MVNIDKEREEHQEHLEKMKYMENYDRKSQGI